MFSKVYPYACLNIDCTWTQWVTGLRMSLYSTENPLELSRKISSLFSNQDNVITTMCIRTAFDLYLQGKNFPKGSEVVMSSINIPEMTRILRRHGLIPVPVDIDIHTLITPADKVEKSITPRTKLILIAMIYGATFDITELAAVATKHNLPIFEDCSECYSGNTFTGNSAAEATSFSFGPIKTATAFGGGVLIIRNAALLSTLKRIHGSYPVQPSKAYIKKIMKYSLGKILLNSEKVNKTLRPILTQLNVDYKKFVVKLMRGFPPSTGLEIYRFQPCRGLLAYLYWRLSTFDEREFKGLTEKLLNATKTLNDGNMIVPGHANKRAGFWLYPVIVNDAVSAYAALNKAGIDAYKGISQLNQIDPPVGSSYNQPVETAKMFEKLLYFPLHKDVPDKVIKEICKTAVEILQGEPRPNL